MIGLVWMVFFMICGDSRSNLLLDVHRLEAYVEFVADYTRDIDAQDFTQQDASFSDQCRELQAVVFHLLVLWQTKLLQLNVLTSHARGRQELM